ncbi:hypothetical protein F5B22DRAFT_598596 [Xylaria bambusicola]|uniref:uncharacterized protein n=1 Tax=Xylaria bambusicola TaxID=326684 RepID=UPI0020086D86|nr:uncharacterized protein F5B22DRAFT_598596 [Xylaria bambusicola]KAI0520842.1 hypothetical protein F5B22DRAFT_598596 [Xylaria bambusicola]
MSNLPTDTKALEQQQIPPHQRLGCKLFIQMSGAPGSGKTTTANLLAPRIDAIAIPHDNIKSLLLDSGVSFDEAGRIAYGLDWVLAENAMRQGLSVIVDTPCLYPQILDRGHALARAHGYTYCYIELRADPDNLAMLDDRLRARVDPLRVQRTAIDDVLRDADKFGGGAEAKEAARERFRAMVANPCRPASNFIVVDACSSLDERIDFVLGQISAIADKEEESAVR